MAQLEYNNENLRLGIIETSPSNKLNIGGQQTAVSWLINYCERENWSLPSDIEKQAKAMEKEQIEEDFIAGEMNNDSHHYTGRKIYQDKHDYYNKTYNK